MRLMTWRALSISPYRPTKRGPICVTVPFMQSILSTRSACDGNA